MTALHFLQRILKTLPATFSSAIEYLAPQLSQTIFMDGVLSSGCLTKRRHPETSPYKGALCARVGRGGRTLTELRHRCLGHLRKKSAPYTRSPQLPQNTASASNLCPQPGHVRVSLAFDCC